MQTVAIFGVGLIGGSFALALRHAGFKGTILGVGSEATLNRAEQLGMIDRGAPAEQAASEADLVYLAQPISAILESLPALNRWVRPDALVTDAGSTKQAIVQRAGESLTRAQFLGGHPIAGKERSGVDQAQPDLFAGRMYVLTPVSDAELHTAPAEEFQSWLKRMGCVPVVLDAKAHDTYLAFTSHLPQLTAVALALTIAQDSPGGGSVFGPALLGATRLASSPYGIWRDILLTNHDAIEAALSSYIRQLQKLRSDLASSEMAEYFREAAALAGALRGGGTGISDPKGT